jgi:hypothetical protein
MPTNWLFMFFEFLPVVLALAASVLCAQKYSDTRRKSERLVCLLGTICAVMLMFAQTSWWSAYTYHGLGLGTDLANHVWSAFNSLTMVAFIVVGWPRSQK